MLLWEAGIQLRLQHEMVCWRWAAAGRPPSLQYLDCHLDKAKTSTRGGCLAALAEPCLYFHCFCSRMGGMGATRRPSRKHSRKGPCLELLSLEGFQPATDSPPGLMPDS